ncbi:alpha/beta hydrolase [Patescibacteria group bacterium]|nr:alpha/beta hydrolase [Patescibacteria group bacterium]
MKTIVILHGTMGSPQGNWFPWLKQEIEKLGHTAIVPKFPTPEGQTTRNWLKILDEAVPAYDENLILVGHSSSPLVICAKLQQLEKSVGAVFLAAPFIGDVGNAEYDELNADFNSFPFDWELIKKRCKKFYIYRSDNDPYVPEEQGRAMAENLGVSEIIIPSGGHLNAETGYTKFPLLFKELEQEICGQ